MLLRASGCVRSDHDWLCRAPAQELSGLDLAQCLLMAACLACSL